MAKQLDEQQLLTRLKSGEKAAVEVWFHAYHNQLLRYVVSKVSVEKDAEELVQETFMNCLKHLPLFRGESGIWTWMCSIAKHEVADYFRKKYAKRAIRTFPLAEILLADQVSDAHQVAEQVRVVLNKMTDQSAELLLAKYVDGKQVKQLALEWERSVKSIESELFRARNEFRVLWLTYQE